MTRSVHVRAPARIDFGGGWTDVPPYDIEQGGRVCNLAIARYAHVQLSEAIGDVASNTETSLAQAALRRAGLHGLHASITSEFPVGAGLGGSSAAGVALSAAIQLWLGNTIADRSRIAEESRETEVDELGIAGGRQDHYAAALGGALDLSFGATIDATRIPLSASLTQKLESQCVLIYTGESRISGATITAVLDAYRQRAAAVTTRLAEMKSLAGEMCAALRREDVNALGVLVGTHWTHQRELHSAISTPLIDRIIQRGARAGAIGAKALGASGGGCVLLIAEEGAADSVAAAVDALGTRLPFTVDVDGVTVSAHT